MKSCYTMSRALLQWGTHRDNNSQNSKLPWLKGRYRFLGIVVPLASRLHTPICIYILAQRLSATSQSKPLGHAFRVWGQPELPDLPRHYKYMLRHMSILQGEIPLSQLMSVLQLQLNIYVCRSPVAEIGWGILCTGCNLCAYTTPSS